MPRNDGSKMYSAFRQNRGGMAGGSWNKPGNRRAARKRIKRIEMRSWKHDI